MTVEDHAALVAMGKAMAARNGYTPMQSSSLYVTDGDEIDWAYGSQRIWMYTMELYPSHAQVSSNLRFYPPDEKIGPETLRNKDAIFYLIERAWCRWAVIGKTTQNCGPLFEDFEISAPWTVNPLGTDTAPTRRLAARRSGGDDAPVGLDDLGSARRSSPAPRPGPARTATTSTGSRRSADRRSSSARRPAT